MCQTVLSCQLLQRGTYRSMITSLGAKRSHGLTTRTTWGLPSTATHQQSAEQGFMQDKIIASHTCFGGHMDVNC